MASQQVLALPPSATGSAGWRRNAEMIDSLPYIDTISDEEKKMVQAMIEEECRRGPKRPADYLAELPPPPTMKFEGHPVLAAEYERVRANPGQHMAPLDTTRYRLDPPAQNRRNDHNAWKASLDNAHAQLEHQATRIQNLELLLKYGDKGWRAQTQLQEATLQRLEDELEATGAAMTKVNQERKLSQLSAGSELSKMHDEYLSMVFKNQEIEAACEALESEIDRLKARLASSQGAEVQAQPQQQQEGGQGAANDKSIANQQDGIQHDVDMTDQDASTDQDVTIGSTVPTVHSNGDAHA